MRLAAVLFCGLALFGVAPSARAQDASTSADGPSLRTRLAEPGPAGGGARGIEPASTPQLRDAPTDLEAAKAVRTLAPPAAPVAPQGPPAMGAQTLIGKSLNAAPLPLTVSGAATGLACRQTCAAQRFQCLATANGPCDSAWASCVIACNLPPTPR